MRALLCFAFAVGFFRSQTLGLIPSLSLSLRRELDGGGLGPIATVFLCESTVLLSRRRGGPSACSVDVNLSPLAKGPTSLLMFSLRDGLALSACWDG